MLNVSCAGFHFNHFGDFLPLEIFIPKLSSNWMISFPFNFEISWNKISMKSASSRTWTMKIYVSILWYQHCDYSVVVKEVSKLWSNGYIKLKKKTKILNFRRFKSYGRKLPMNMKNDGTHPFDWLPCCTSAYKNNSYSIKPINKIELKASLEKENKVRYSCNYTNTLMVEHLFTFTKLKLPKNWTIIFLYKKKKYTWYSFFNNDNMFGETNRFTVHKTYEHFIFNKI